MTLTDFLLARIAEDEEAAREAHRDMPAPPDFTVQGWPSCEYPGRVLIVGVERFLAECEAKRSIVELHSHAIGRMPDRARSAVHYLADVYADHPDYRDEWRP